KSKTVFVLLLAGVFASGCRTYQYRILQPTGIAQPVGDQPAVVRYDPLEYRLVRNHDRLDLRIFNPTDERIVLLGNRSYVVDPRGESHPVRGRVVGPHSFTGMLLPPEPITFPSYGYGWGWGWGPYAPFYDPFYTGFYSPPVYYNEIITPYDW